VTSPLNSRSRWRFAALSLLSWALASCVIAPDQQHQVDGVVMVAPPAPRSEVVGSPPAAGYVWTAGYWNWVGNRHVWVDGAWVAPRTHHHWVDSRWVRQGDGWRFEAGHWARG
jgi:WXXGXW repeat (2 copies)